MSLLTHQPLGYKLAVIVLLKLLFLFALYQFVIRPQVYHVDASSTSRHLMQTESRP